MANIVFVALAGCGPSVPERCDDNVRRVVSLAFSGPEFITTTPGYDFAGYDVTITVEKEDPVADATVCCAVRDHDPWTKGPWAVDDVLDAFVIGIPARRDTITREALFVLYAGGDDDDVCGAGSLPGDAKVEGCSGEREAEVYVQLIGSAGPESSRRDVRLAAPGSRPPPPPYSCPEDEKCCQRGPDGDCLLCIPRTTACPIP